MSSAFIINFSKFVNNSKSTEKTQEMPSAFLRLIMDEYTGNPVELSFVSIEFTEGGGGLFDKAIQYEFLAKNGAKWKITKVHSRKGYSGTIQVFDRCEFFENLSSKELKEKLYQLLRELN